MPIRHTTADLDKVCRFFADEYEIDGHEIFNTEHWVDVGKREVVFALYLDPEEEGEEEVVKGEETASEEEVDSKEVLLNLAASISIADHLGDVVGDLNKALELIGEDLDARSLQQLYDEMRDREVRTLYGNNL